MSTIRTEILNLPPAPWISLPEGEQYALACAIGRAIVQAGDGKSVTWLKDADGTVIAGIAAPGWITPDAPAPWEAT